MSDGTRAERLLCGYLAAIPLLWVTGLTLPVAFVLFGWLALCVRSRRALVAAWPWAAVGCCQVVSVVVNMAADREPPVMLLKHLFASYVSGWFLIAAAVAIGASGAVRSAPFLRAAVRVGVYCLAAAALLYPLALLTADRILHVRTPLGFFVPENLPAARFSFGMLLFTKDELFGVSLPRLSMFHPWSTALGFSGLGLCFVAMNAEQAPQRRLGVACGVAMVAAALGRAAFVALIVCLVLRWLLASARHAPIPVACAVAAVGLAAVIAVAVTRTDPADVAVSLRAIRPGATQARDLIEKTSWVGWENAPLLGHGWTGRTVYPPRYRAGITMVVGSHSSVSGLLYVGGLVTFVAFVFALLHTAALLVFSRGDPPAARNTVALLVGTAMIATSESLPALVLSSLFLYVWIGIAIARCRPAERAPRYEALRVAA